MLVDEITLDEDFAIPAAQVRQPLPIMPWAMLRIHNEHSQAFRGRYSPETSPWGVEICESQYWPHVRTVDVVGPNQIGKTFHACELPTLYDLVEAREAVFYMNGSLDNALNLWTTRWSRTLRADPVLQQQLLDRMEAGRQSERTFADGGLLYSAGPESAAALSQRESRVVRCSELEKTIRAIGNEASSYALARDRAGAYPGTSIVTTDCTVTVREGLSWIRFRSGDRSRPFIPCPGCGHYACPAHQRHLDEEDLALDLEAVHLLEIPAIASTTPSAAKEETRLVCRRCGHLFTTRTFRESARAVVWVPVGCHVVRHDDPVATPIPRVRWLDELRAWAGEQLADPDVVEGKRSPAAAPVWSGPRVPDGVELAWSPDAVLQTSANAAVLPAFRADPRQSSARSFWIWRLFAPKYTIGQIGEEIVAGDVGSITGDQLDDYKTATQKCFVLPYVELIIGSNEDVSEDAVRCCIGELARGARPERTVAISAGVDINEDRVRAVKRAWTQDGQTYLVDHVSVSTGKWTAKEQGQNFEATRTAAIYAALDRVWEWLHTKAETTPGMTFIDSGYLSDEIYQWCASKSFSRVRPSKGFGAEGTIRRRQRGALPGQWTDACEKRALDCADARGRPLRHQYYELDDARRLMKLHVDHWKKEVHNGVRVGSLFHKAEKAHTQEAALKPWFFLHADLLREDPDGYIKQLVAERWEEWRNPKTDRLESGWREYAQDNHFLDCEGYAFAAAALLGVDVGRMRGGPARQAPRRGRTRLPRPAPRTDPMLG